LAQAASNLLTGTSSQNFTDEVERIELEKHVQTKTATVDCSGSKIPMLTISPVNCSKHSDITMLVIINFCCEW